MNLLSTLCITIIFVLSVLGCSFALVSLRYDTNNYDCAKPKLDSDQGDSEEIKAELQKK